MTLDIYVRGIMVASRTVDDGLFSDVVRALNVLGCRYEEKAERLPTTNIYLDEGARGQWTAPPASQVVGIDLRTGEALRVPSEGSACAPDCKGCDHRIGGIHKGTGY